MKNIPSTRSAAACLAVLGILAAAECRPRAAGAISGAVFEDFNPEVRLELDLSPRRVDLLAERFDLAVRVASRLPDDSTLVARKLCELQNGLYASPAYLARFGIPEKPQDLLEHIGLRLIGGNGDALPWRLSRGAEQWEGMPDGPLAANSPRLHATLPDTAWGSSASTTALRKTG